MEFDIGLKYFIFMTMILHPKSFVLCPKIVLPVQYMVLAAIYMIIPRYYRIHGKNVRLVYKISYKLALFSILILKC